MPGLFHVLCGPLMYGMPILYHNDLMVAVFC